MLPHNTDVCVPPLEGIFSVTTWEKQLVRSSSILWQNDLNISNKNSKRIDQTVVKPLLYHGSEIWALYTEMKKVKCVVEIDRLGAVHILRHHFGGRGGSAKCDKW